MGILNALMTYGKAKVAGKLIRRGMGGNAATALMAAYLGKKAFDYLRARRRTARAGDEGGPLSKQGG